ncbi:MAG TPA: hypothetical protein VFH80_04670 [Solirubrobacteraceae bacterium]|nr:hypothetical protein [Solirubrobacteraceae bacterium]
MTTVDPTVELLDDAPARAAFLSSSRLTVLDHFRVPYELDPELVGPVEQLCPWRGGSALLWKRDLDGPVVHTTLLGVDGVTPIPLFTRLLSDEMIEPVLHAHGGRWERAWRLMSPDGAPVASIWQAEDGSVFLPFDPNEVVESFWSERYLRTAAGQHMRTLRRGLMFGYYRVRPLLPRPVQIWLRRRFARLQGRSAFPRWPIEPCLHDFFDLMFAILARIAHEPVPYIAPWPNGHTWALVLTHDVEQAEGLAAVDPVVALEQAHDVRSSWNLVPRRYEVDPDVVSRLVDEGCEIGVHGIYHDGRDLRSWSRWQRRLPIAYEAAEGWNAVGFRSASLHRHHDWMRSLEFDYDSSSPDMDPFEPQNGGCCTWLPFFNGELVELPLTLPQDHTLFVILDHLDETVWVAKAEFLRAHGGMAMIDTHPDYLIDERIFGAYARFLDRFADDPTAWHALPREVSAWWRRRGASRLEHDGSTWQIVGPAASEGRVVFAAGAR